MPPKNDYDNILMMQQNAERRVRDMRARARSAAMSDDAGSFAPPLNRNWSSATGRGHQLPSQPLRPSGSAPRYSPPQGTQGNSHPNTGTPHGETQRREQPPVRGRDREAHRPREVPPPKEPGGTILGDVMGALGLEEDTLLIIGLLLILINQKADTTLLLALAYLLI